MYLDNERRPTLTPQLAFRIAVIGGVALVMFAVIFFRLWYLQVLSGDNYVAAARDNRVREIKVQAPRGEIVDRHGQPLVENRSSLSIKLTPDKLPNRLADREEVYRRLSKLLGLKPRRLEKRVEGELDALPFAKPTVKQDVDGRLVAYLLERQEDFPGVERRARVPPRVPARPGRRPPVRPGRRGQPRGAEGRALQRRVDGRPHRQGGDRVRVRPLPPRPQRRRARGGGRARQPHRHARPGGGRPGQAAPAVARPRGPARGSGGARRRHRKGRVRRDERRQRRGPGARLAALLRPERVHQADHASGSSTRSAPRSSASRCSTAPSRPAIPRARRSSSSRPWPLSRAGTSRRPLR